MELDKCIKKRRSIREFKEKDVDNKLIKDLIKYARLAPSAKNRQNWKFLIIKNDTKNKIADIMLKKEKSIRRSLSRQLYGKNSSVKETAKIIKNAPVLILVLKECDKNWLEGDSLSIGACVEHICLRATDIGLGSLWIRDTEYTKKEIVKLVGYENMELSCAIAIGYQAEHPRQRSRKKINEIMEWYKDDCQKKSNMLE